MVFLQNRIGSYTLDLSLDIMSHGFLSVLSLIRMVIQRCCSLYGLAFDACSLAHGTEHEYQIPFVEAHVTTSRPKICMMISEILKY